MSWHRCENGEDVRPTEVDDTSSAVYVYVRRNIVEVAESQERPAHYEWDELRIPRSSWEIWEQVEINADAISDVASMAAGNEVSVNDLADAFAEYVEYNESKV